MKEPAKTSEADLPRVFGETALSTQVARPEFAWEQDRSVSIEQIVFTLLRRKWVFVAVVLSVLAVAMGRTYLVVPLYRAAATLQIDDGRQKLMPYQGFDAPIQPWKYIDTQIQRIQSPGFIEQLEEKLGRPVDAAVVANQVGDTMLVTLSATTSDPDEAAFVANLAGETFIETHQTSKLESSGRASSVLEDQLAQLQDKVQASEAALLAYGREKSIVNLTDRETMARKRMSDLTDEVAAAEKSLFDFKAQIDQVGAAGGIVDLPAGLRSPNLTSIEDRLRDIELSLAGLSVRFGAEWPAIKKLEEERAELNQQRARELLVISGDLRKSSDLAQGLHAKLVAELGAQRGVVDRLSEDLIQYEILQRESELNKQLYEGLLQRLKEGGIAESLTTEKIELVYRATPPARPVSPNRPRALIQGLVLGLFIGLGVVVLLEMLDNTVKSVEDITQRLRLPALGMIPALKNEGGGSRRRWFGRTHAESDTPALAFEVGATGQTAEQEAYRSLRTSLLLSHSGNPPQALLVTSAFPQDGKSTTALNTAISLAQTGARTVIVDMDLRNSSVAPSLEMSSEQGMSTYLSGNSDLASQIRETRYPNLFVVPGGPPPPNPAELIGSSRMATGMQLLREYFTYVVVDSPPCIGLSDPLLISPLVDGVILVARSARTPRRALQRAAEALNQVGATFLGVLVNNVRAEARLYGYDYGSYGRYYGRYYPSTARSSRKTA